MPPSNARSNNTPSGGLSDMKPSLAFVIMIFGALIAFEIFNFSTTDHALSDLLGDLTFAGIPWSVILAIAFCGIDFAGIARLFTPEQGADEPKEVWYLFGAWLLAATMNAILTWWGVSIAVTTHSQQSSSVVDPQTINMVVPVFVAIMVWVIRILIIGTLSLALDRLLHPGAEQHMPMQSIMSSHTHNAELPTQRPMSIPSGLNASKMPARPNMSRAASSSQRPNQQPVYEDDDSLFDAPPTRSRGEASYHSLGASGRGNGSNGGANNSGNDRFRRS